MEEQLSFVQYQLWLLIGLLVLLVVTNLVCYFMKREVKPNRREQPEFSVMWDRDQLDALIKTADDYLRDYPNHEGALYFGAKALIARRRFPEAKEKLARLVNVQPYLRSSVQEMVDECDRSNDR